MSLVETETQLGLFDTLPKELHGIIFLEILDAQALMNFFCVCRSWSVFAFDEKFWHEICKKSFDLVGYSAPRDCGWRWTFLSKQPLTTNAKIGRKEFDRGYYEGEWLDGQYHGKGVKFVTETKYVGEWENGQRCGFGIYHSNGDVYTGMWSKDRRNGEGTLVWKSGSRYTGNFLDDGREGQGSYFWSNGDVYEGEWHLSLRTGKGKIVWAEGNSYEGDWFEGFQHGHGVYKWIDGDKFEGGWSRNSKHGKGKYTWGCGDESEGQWENDSQVGEGYLVWKNGNSFRGEWIDGVHEIGNYYEKASGRAFSRTSQRGTSIHLEESHPDIVSLIQKNVCTFQRTGQRCYFQYLWKTKEIDTRTHGVCVSCKNICVPQNEVVLLEPEKHYFGGNFYCDCGAGNLAKPCRAKGYC